MDILKLVDLSEDESHLIWEHIPREVPREFCMSHNFSNRLMRNIMLNGIGALKARRFRMMESVSTKEEADLAWKMIFQTLACKSLNAGVRVATAAYMFSLCFRLEK
jgi:hypothetical protein